MEGNILFSIIGAALAGFGVVNLYGKKGFELRKDWSPILFIVFGVGIIMAMMKTIGAINFSICLLWLFCIGNFALIFSCPVLQQGWIPIISSLSVVSVFLVLEFSKWFWIGVVFMTLFNLLSAFLYAMENALRDAGGCQDDYGF